MRTGRKQYRGDARRSGHHHAQAKRPPATPSIHYDPARHVTGNLGEGREQKAQMLLVPQSRPVVRETDVHHIVGEPNRDEKCTKTHLQTDIKVNLMFH